MRGALAAELRKIITARPLLWATLGALVVAAGVPLLLRNSFQGIDAELTADRARGLIQAGALGLGAVLGGLEARHLTTAWLAVPRRWVWLVAHWAGVVVTTLLVTGLMTLLSRAPIRAEGEWVGSWLWFSAVTLAVFLLAELLRSPLLATVAVMVVLWVAPLVLRNVGAIIRWLPDGAPFNGWEEVRPGIAACWLLAVVVVSVVGHAVAAGVVRSRRLV